MLTSLGAVAARAWSVLPQLIAVYLAGLLVHDLAFWWAAKAAVVHPLLPVLILPIGLLGTLGAVIGMLLLMRPAIPVMENTGDSPSDGAASPQDRRTETFTAMTAAVLPFVAFYSAAKYLTNDYFGFQFDALNNTMFRDIPDTFTLAVGVAGLLFVVRAVLKRRDKKLPRWTTPVVFYLEAMWIYLLLSAWLPSLDVKSWLTTRRIVVWARELIHAVLQHIPGATAVWDAGAWLVGQVTAVTVVPLGWLTLAGVVYALVPMTTTWADTRRDLLAGRPEGAAERRMEHLAADRTTRVIGKPLRAQAVALRDAAYVILHMGVLRFAGYILAFTVLGWLFGNSSVVPERQGWVYRQIALLIGPHDTAWWGGVTDFIGLIPGLVASILQICLIVAVYAAFVADLKRQPRVAA